MLRSEYSANRELLMAKRLADQRRAQRVNPIRTRRQHVRYVPCRPTYIGWLLVTITLAIAVWVG